MHADRWDTLQPLNQGYLCEFSSVSSYINHETYLEGHRRVNCNPISQESSEQTHESLLWCHPWPVQGSHCLYISRLEDQPYHTGKAGSQWNENAADESHQNFQLCQKWHPCNWSRILVRRVRIGADWVDRTITWNTSWSAFRDIRVKLLLECMS